MPRSLSEFRWTVCTMAQYSMNRAIDSTDLYVAHQCVHSGCSMYYRFSSSTGLGSYASSRYWHSSSVNLNCEFLTASSILSLDDSPMIGQQPFEIDQAVAMQAIDTPCLPASSCTLPTMISSASQALPRISLPRYRSLLSRCDDWPQGRHRTPLANGDQGTRPTPVALQYGIISRSSSR